LLEVILKWFLKMAEEDKTIAKKTGSQVKLASFGKNLFVEIKKYPLSKAGNKINVVDTGAGYFMPEIGPNHFLYWPVRKKYVLFGEWLYEPIYFALKRGKSCINFGLENPEAYGPDIEQIDGALTNNLASQVGANVNKSTPWALYIIILLQGISMILLAQMAGVIR